VYISDALNHNGIWGPFTIEALKGKTLRLLAREGREGEVEVSRKFGNAMIESKTRVNHSLDKDRAAS